MIDNEIDKTTVIIEKNDNFTRVRTQCNDQNYVRDYFMSQLSQGAAIAACSYLLDMLMSMSVMSIQTLDSAKLIELTPEQKANLQKLSLYHDLLSSTGLGRDVWEMDWVYVDVKHQQDLLGLQFFEKRAELNLGTPLPAPVPNPVPDL